MARGAVLVRLLGLLGLLGSMLIRRAGLWLGVGRDTDARRLGPRDCVTVDQLIHLVPTYVSVPDRQRHPRAPDQSHRHQPADCR